VLASYTAALSEVQEFTMYIPTGLRLAGCVLLLAGLTASPARAQELAGSFDQLRVLVKPGDTVTVTDSTGQEARGTIAALSSNALELLVAGNRRNLLENDVRTIRQRRGDPLGNGAKWGFGIGAALGLIGGIAAVAEYDDSAAVVPVLALLYGGLGAGIGVGIDAMISSDRVIYSRTTTTSAEVTQSSGPDRRRIGIRASLAF
jgi:hypothetical protein